MISNSNGNGRNHSNQFRLAAWGKFYKPEDIRRWGVQRFMDEVAPKLPFKIPDLEFSEEENRRMDELLQEERNAANDGL